MATKRVKALNLSQLRDYVYMLGFKARRYREALWHLRMARSCLLDTGSTKSRTLANSGALFEVAEIVERLVFRAERRASRASKELLAKQDATKKR